LPRPVGPQTPPGIGDPISAPQEGLHGRVAPPILNPALRSRNRHRSGLIPQLYGSGWGVLTTMVYLFSTNVQRVLAWGLRLRGAGIIERGWTITD
jgi:hypothetical protein